MTGLSACPRSRSASFPEERSSRQNATYQNSEQTQCFAVTAQSGLIRVSGGQFVDDSCKPFVFSGYNTWQVCRELRRIEVVTGHICTRYRSTKPAFPQILETAGNACCGGRASVQTQLDAARTNLFALCCVALLSAIQDHYLRTC